MTILNGTPDGESLWAELDTPYTINGAGGDDQISGGEHADLLNGDAGNDYIYGGLGADRLNGGDGDDYLQGDDGDDSLYGGLGADALYGGAGDDSLYGGDGDDTLSGDEGDDLLEGGAGADTLYGGAGANTLRGGDGADVLWDDSSNGAARLDGGAGDDVIHLRSWWESPADQVSIDGGAGTDTLYAQGEVGSGVSVANVEILDGMGLTANAAFYSAFSTLRAEGYEGGNLAYTLSGSGSATFRIAAGFGANIFGSEDDNGIDASSAAGPVSLYGYGGDDTLIGGAGNDSLDGHDGDDLLEGGAGNDTLSGGAGSNTLRGGLGDDEIWADGSAALSVLEGEAGDDRFHINAGSWTPEGAALTIDGGSGVDTVFAQGDLAQTYSQLSATGVEILRTSSLVANAAFFNAFSTITTEVGNENSGVNLTLTGGGVATFNLADGVPSSIYGSVAAETLDASGATANLYMHGDAGNDTLLAGAGADTLEGGYGNDSLHGGGGDDELYGGEGDDILDGGAGDDLLYSGAGANTLRGGEGDDELFFSSDSPLALFEGGAGDDRFHLTYWYMDLNATVSIDGGAGQDIVYALVPAIPRPGSRCWRWRATSAQRGRSTVPLTRSGQPIPKTSP